MRPRIKLKLTPAEQLMETVSTVAFVMIFVLLILNWSQLPNIIPTHFNAVGKADDFGNKETLFLIPILAAGLHILMTVIQFFPNIYNYPVKVTEENAQRLYTVGRQMIIAVKLEMDLLFLYIFYKTVDVALGKATGLGGGFLVIVLGVTFGTIGLMFYYILKAAKPKKEN